MEQGIFSLNPVNHHTRLLDGKSIQQFLQFLKEQTKNPNVQIQSYRGFFMAASSLSDAYLILCICFGGLSFYSQLKMKGVFQQTIKYMQKQASTFNWSQNKSALELFQQNSKKFSKHYPYYYKNILTKLKQKQCEELFKKMTEKSPFLSGVKIRKWINKKQIQQYRLFKRQNEKYQIARVQGTTYLLIAKTSTDAYNVGVLFQEVQRVSKSNRQRSDEIKLNEGSEEKNAINRIDIQVALNPKQNDFLKRPSQVFDQKSENKKAQKSKFSVQNGLIDKKDQNKSNKRNVKESWWKRYICCCLTFPQKEQD